jgi:hypothetical protein
VGLVPAGKKTEIKTVSWNTGDLNKRVHSNASHAERQLTYWLEMQHKKDETFLPSVVSITISLESPKAKDSPCPMCAADLKEIAKYFPTAERKISFTGLYTCPGIVTVEEAQAAVESLQQGPNKWDVKDLGRGKKGEKLGLKK